MDDIHILLTNDDGIDSLGLKMLYDQLADRWDVTAVAPMTDRSGAGLTMNTNINVEAHERGYAVKGTPVDCVEVALGGLDVHPDIVVSGCNPGPNIGAHNLGRSGTVGAAIEAGFVGVPAIAVSLYDATQPVLWPPEDISSKAHSEAVRVTEYLIERTLEAGVFEVADYLNLTVPMYDPDKGRPPLRLTRPSESFEIYTPANIQKALDENDGELTFRDQFWEELAEGTVDDPVGTDRRAIADGETSISPLRTIHEVHNPTKLESIVAEYARNN